jgi:hypothetical protein
MDILVEGCFDGQTDEWFNVWAEGSREVWIDGLIHGREQRRLNMLAKGLRSEEKFWQELFAYITSTVF